MSDASTSNEVSLYDNYNYENGKPVTTFFPVIIDEKTIGEVNPDGTSAAINVDEASAASITSEDLEKAGVVTLLVGIVPPEKNAAIKSKISKMAKDSGGIGLEEGGVVAYKREEEKKRTNNGMEKM